MKSDCVDEYFEEIAKSRGYDDKFIDGYTAEFVMPDILVEESIKADSVLCY